MFKKIFAVFFLQLIFASSALSVNAADPRTVDTGDIFKETPACTGNKCLTNPLGNVTPQALIGKVINSVLGIVGSLALAMFIYGGLRWMTAHGSPEGVTAGTETMKWATLGLVVIFTAYALVKFVITSIGG